MGDARAGHRVLHASQRRVAQAEHHGPRQQPALVIALIGQVLAGLGLKLVY